LTKGRQGIDVNATALVHEMETLRAQLHLMARSDRKSLTAEGVYRLSRRLDNLIVQYMRAYAC